MARAGKVAITPKGTFENGTVYEKLDTVEYNGTLYIAKKASSGVLPTDTEYWMLAVDLTGKMDTTGDSQNNIVTFTSADATDPTGWQDVQVLTSKEKHASLFKKISTMMSNMRYMYKILGTTDISALGSVTQAIANLNSNVGGIKGISSSAAITTQGQYALDAREKNASVDGTLANKIDVLNSNLPLQNYINLWDTPIIASEINVYYTYTHTILKGKKCIIANFQTSIGNILVSYVGHSTGIVKAKSDNQYWGGEIECTFDSDTGTISFKVIWIGQSQTISNFKLTGIVY